MPSTALKHFDQDLGRARGIVGHADPLPTATVDQRLLRSDLLRSGWMFAVGAIDAYFCDAYADIVAATIIAKDRYPAGMLPEFFNQIRVPIRAIIEPYSTNENWRWRMAARKMMERENVLSLSAVQRLFNPFFPKGRRLFGDVLQAWIRHPDSTKRLFGITRTAFAALAGPQQAQAIRDASEQMEERYRDLFQRRHDCIHNCDRPRVSPQPLDVAATVVKVIQDAEFLVNRCDEHVAVEFRAFLARNGFPSAIIAQAGY